jgi:outer membrane biosynthesis protein TonB
MKFTRERRNIMLAIIASLLLHFIVAVSLASFGDKLQSPLPEEEKPVELTIVDPIPMPPPVTPKNPMFVDTPEKRETKEEPKEKTFESNANSIAASQLPALGEAPVPTQEGKDRPNMDLENEQYAVAQNGAQPTPPPTPPPPKSTPASTPSVPPPAKPVETPSPTPIPTLTPNEELLAMFRATPPPTIRAPDETERATPTPSVPPQEERPTPPPQQPSSAYRREQTQTHMRGNISNRGVASVNALGTPLGRYNKLVYDAIGSRWYSLVRQNGDRINIGTVALTFVVDRDGHITKLRLASNSSDESFSNLCLQSVQDARLPPIPEDVAAALPPDGLDQEVNFTIYPNR